jgi:protein TonB
MVEVNVELMQPPPIDETKPPPPPPPPPVEPPPPVKPTVKFVPPKIVKDEHGERRTTPTNH